MKLLPAHLKPVLDNQRDLLTRLRALLSASEASNETLEALDGVIEHLSALFLVVIVGEFNAGKSSVVNALFGEKVMEEGPIPTTARITVLRHGEERTERTVSDFLVERRYPSPMLKHLELVDTPGTNSIIKQHQELTEAFVPRADLVLFVTSYDRPLTDSESQFLHFLREVWGKRLVFVLNKADLARSADDLRQVINHIRSNAQELMHFEPEIFPVSAEQAYAAKHTADAKEKERLWEASRFDALETFMLKTLAGPAQLKLKLAAPLDVAERQLAALQTQFSARQQVLAQDEANLADLNRRLDETKALLQTDYQHHLDSIDKLLLEMERRGVQFLDDTIRVGKISMLKDRDQFKEEFARQVLRDADRRIEDQVTEAVDSLFKHALTLWNQVLSDFAEQVRKAGRSTGTMQSTMDYNRAAVFETMMKGARQKLETNDLREEARRILENSRNASEQFQAAQIGAGVFGILGTVLMISTGADVVGGAGLVTGGVLAVAGLTVLPRQRRKAIREFTDQVEGLRAELRQALVRQFDREIEAALTKIESTTQPYRSLVTAERDALAQATAEHRALTEQTASIRKQIAKA
ncbi:MAG: dynamin family protein [Rhodothermales bacterium]